MSKPCDTNSPCSKLVNQLPDVSNEGAAVAAGTLNRVGMEAIEMPILFADPDGKIVRQSAKIDAYVSLDDSHSKGIHMSRLYLALQNMVPKEPLSLPMLRSLLEQFVESQAGLSGSSFIRVQFNLMVQRKALLSQELGWREYPVLFEGALENGKCEFVLGAEVMYSSTCPCSAALSRQLIQEQFAKDFEGNAQVDPDSVFNWLGKESSIVATPHAQRSRAQFKVKLKEAQFAPDILSLIDLVETRLGTPVQAAVKRKDEQEFARLNAQNLMFCEDAARKIKSAFEEDNRIIDYYAHVAHVESLHPHNAVSVITKGVDEGFRI